MATQQEPLLLDREPGHRPVPDASRHVFVARQPILDSARKVHAYELLLSDFDTAHEPAHPADGVSAEVISSAVLSIGLDALAGGRPGFITISRHVLVNEMPEVLRPDLTVLLLGDDIEVDAETRHACVELRRQGFRFAINQFACSDRVGALLPLTHYAKVDMRTMQDAPAMRRFLHEHRPAPHLIASHVDAHEDFLRAQSHSLEFFQGAFLGGPAIQRVRSLPGNTIEYLQLLKSLQDPDMSVAHIERLVTTDASLTYRILRTVNSAAFGQRVEVSSIRHALVLVGCGTVRRWVSLWLLAGIADRTPEELITMSTIRAKWCELLCKRLGWDDASEGFLLGLCSLLDAILECPMESVLEQLPLSKALTSALTGDSTRGRHLLDCMVAYERGDWAVCASVARKAGFDVALLPAAYGEALLWADAFRKTAA